jgi:hypothetical protein
MCQVCRRASGIFNSGNQNYNEIIRDTGDNRSPLVSSDSTKAFYSFQTFAILQL